MKAKNKTVHYLLNILAFFLVTFFSVSAQGETYYVSANGSDTWAKCSSIATPCSLSTAVANADDGDFVFLRGGDYGSQVLKPSNSGSSGNVITFVKYADETPSFTRNSGGSRAPSVYLSSKDYIVISGLTFTGGSGGHIYLYYADYNEIKNCIFSGNVSYPPLDISNSNYNYVHDNTFGPGGDCDPDTGCLNDSVYISESDYNRIINNEFSESGNHGVFWLRTAEYNVIRGNTTTMTEGYRSDPDFYPSELVGAEKNSNRNLVEDNEFIFIGTPPTSTDAEYTIAQINSSSNMIFRKNVYNNIKGLIAFYINQSFNAEENRFYNNTFYKVNNVAAYKGWVQLESSSTQYTRYNEFVNNLVHTNYSRGYLIGDEGNHSRIVDNVFRNNLQFNVMRAAVSVFGKQYANFVNAKTSYPDTFINTLISNPKLNDPANGDFTLQKDSPAKNAGGWLTTIVSSTASGVTSFVVDDSRYFYDGWGIPDESGDLLMTQGAKGEQKKATKIIKIDYKTNTITVSNPIDIEKGEGLSLIYFESAPDIGAHEYQGAIANPTPKNESDDSNEMDHTVTKPGGTIDKFQPGPDWCRDFGPCPEGQGDCDGDAECQSGLICAQDVGADYGWPADRDVCEKPAGSSDIFQPGPDWCRDFGPCPEGQGDCDGDAECQSGLICAQDVGADYGWPADRDVCEKPAGSSDIFQPGPDWCRDYGPCSEGQGDCDGDAECQSGLICAQDVGADYGWPADRDVCERPAGTKDDAVAISSPTGFVIKSSQN